MSEDEVQGYVGLPHVAREAALAATFVTLADTLGDNYDVIELLDALISACLGLFGVAAAGVMLRDQRGSLSSVASSDDRSRLLGTYQTQMDGGPCLDSVRAGAAVRSENLKADAGRWPDFVPRALSAGFESVVALPLRLRADTIGGLTIYDVRPTLMTEEDQGLAQALADVTTIGILQQRATYRSAELAGQLQHALDSRVFIEQAKGVIAERAGVDMRVAFETLRSYARNRNIKLSVVAQQIVEGKIDPTKDGH